MVGDPVEVPGERSAAAVDDERAVKVVEAFLELLNTSRDAWSADWSSAAYRMTKDKIKHDLPLIAALGADIDPTFPSKLHYGMTDATWPFLTIRDGVLQLLGTLRHRKLASDIIGPTGPQFAASQLHESVWNAAARLWDGKHYRESVERAATAVDDLLRVKLGRSDIRGHALVAQAFTKDAPKQGEPRLRFVDIDPRDRARWNDAHVGAMHFGMGCMMAIRNMVAHDTGEIYPQVALEQLAALSVLARWIDRAEIVREAGLGAGGAPNLSPPEPPSPNESAERGQ
jgi:hypothetical protein